MNNIDYLSHPNNDSIPEEESDLAWLFHIKSGIYWIDFIKLKFIID